ncbi:unnamed protein product [Lampetra fluviatilis]
MKEATPCATEPCLFPFTDSEISEATGALVFHVVQLSRSRRNQSLVYRACDEIAARGLPLTVSAPAGEGETTAGVKAKPPCPPPPIGCPVAGAADAIAREEEREGGGGCRALSIFFSFTQEAPRPSPNDFPMHERASPNGVCARVPQRWEIQKRREPPSISAWEDGASHRSGD